MRLVFNPTSKEVNLTLSGEQVVILPKQSAVLPDKVGRELQDLLPGLEYAKMSDEEAEKLNKDIEDAKKAREKELADAAKKKAEDAAEAVKPKGKKKKAGEASAEAKPKKKAKKKSK